VIERAGAAGYLHAEGGVLVGVAGRRQRGAHVAPVDVKFFGQRHRQRRMHALAEFETVDRDRNRIVRRDQQERLRRRRRCLGRRAFLRQRARHGQHAQRQAAARKAGQLEKAAAVQHGGATGRRGAPAVAAGQRFELSDSHGVVPFPYAILKPARAPHP
jgi:hypothetical protein